MLNVWHRGLNNSVSILTYLLPHGVVKGSKATYLHNTQPLATLSMISLVKHIWNQQHHKSKVVETVSKAPNLANILSSICICDRRNNCESMYVSRKVDSIAVTGIESRSGSLGQDHVMFLGLLISHSLMHRKSHQWYNLLLAHRISWSQNSPTQSWMLAWGHFCFLFYSSQVK